VLNAVLALVGGGRSNEQGPTWPHARGLCASLSIGVILWVVGHGVREAPTKGGSYRCGSVGGDSEPRSPIPEGDAVDATQNAVPPPRKETVCRP
jgi:hypothetical protein